MERLVHKIGKNNVVPIKFDLDFIFGIDNDVYEGLCEIFNALCDYQDTNLTPAEIEAMKAENERLKAYRTEIKLTPNDDGECWCPTCDCEIVGYYAEYCEHCGQSISYKEYQHGE